MMLRELLLVYRKSKGLSLRAIARQCKVSHVTLHRFEKGHPIMDAEFVKIWTWLTSTAPKS